MKRALIIIGILLLILLVLIGVISLKGKNATQPVSNTNPASGFPLGNSTGSGKDSNTTGASSNTTMSIVGQNGSSITTKDFVHNGTTVADTENVGNYYLAGSVGYCLPDGSCPAGAASKDYTIEYLSQDKSFIIALTSEPIGQARLDAEEFLMKTLGISEQQMCALNYQVLTTESVNSEYAGVNLGFSFCTGATQLPQ